MHTISPWAATVHADLENSTVIWEKEFKNYTFQAFNTGDSLWIVASWPDRGKIAFRAAFGMNCCFEVTNLLDDGALLVINLETRLGKYEVCVTFPDSDAILLHYTTSCKANMPLLIPFWARDIIAVTKHGNVENTNGLYT